MLCLDALTGNYEDDFEDVDVSESFATEDSSNEGSYDEEDDEAQVDEETYSTWNIFLAL